MYWWPNRGSANDTEVNELVFGIEGELGSDWTWEAYYQDGSTTMETRNDRLRVGGSVSRLAAQPNFGRGGSITVAAANRYRHARLTCTSGSAAARAVVGEPNYEVIYPSGFELSQDCVDAITVDMQQRNIVEQNVDEGELPGQARGPARRRAAQRLRLSNRDN